MILMTICTEYIYVRYICVYCTIQGNPGGPLQSGLDLASIFLPKNTALLQMTTHNKTEIYKSLNRKSITKKQLNLLILIDKDTASASEVFTTALMDNYRAIVAGTTSLGKNVAQALIRLSDNSAVALTIALFKGPYGKDLGQGLCPHLYLSSYIHQSLLNIHRNNSYNSLDNGYILHNYYDIDNYDNEYPMNRSSINENITNNTNHTNNNIFLKQNREIESLKEKLKMSQTEVFNLQKQLQSTHNNISSITTKHQQQQQQKLQQQSITKDVIQASSEYKKIEQERDSLLDFIQTELDTNKKYITTIQSIETELNQSKTQNQQLSSQIQAMDLQINNYINQLQISDTNMTELDRQYKTLITEKNEWLIEQESLKNSVKLKNEEVVRLTSINNDQSEQVSIFFIIFCIVFIIILNTVAISLSLYFI